MTAWLGAVVAGLSVAAAFWIGCVSGYHRRRREEDEQWARLRSYINHRLAEGRAAWVSAKGGDPATSQDAAARVDELAGLRWYVFGNDRAGPGSS